MAKHAAAFLAYAAVSAVFIDHGTSLTTTIFGHGSDPYAYIWLLAWWPWAVAHHQNLLLSQLMWHPLGLKLLWVASMPLVCLALAPLTLSAGPVVAFNVIILAAPVLSAFCAYRLCLYVTRDYIPSLIGGFLFGFSTYETAMDYATPNLSVTFLLPCLLLLALHRLNGTLSRRAAVPLAAVMMLAAFFISTEVAATAAVFGTIAAAAAFALYPAQRPGLRRLAVDALLAAGIALALLLPLLANMFGGGPYINLPALWPYFFVADPVNLVIPTPFTWLGGHWATAISKTFPGIDQERGAYLGLPLLVILWLFLRQNGRKNLLSWLLCLFLLLSLGPCLWIGGHYTALPLPWIIGAHLPLIAGALPARFALYVSLVCALIVPLWIIANPAQRRARLGAAALACLCLLPAPHPAGPVPDAAFFRPGRVTQVLGPNPTLLVLPFGGTGPSTYWQAESGFAYRQAGGYMGFPPRAMQHFAAVPQLFGDYQTPHFAADLAAFVIACHTDAVVAGPGTPPAVLSALNSLGWPHRVVDDVVLFQVPK